MRVSLLVLATLCAAPISAACDLSGVPTSPVAQQVTIAGFVGKGVFSDSVTLGAPFQLVASDSSGKDTGDLIMAGDVVPPTGTYDLNTGSFPPGLSSLAVEFLRQLAGGTSELYQPSSGNMIIATTARDSIAGTLDFSMLLAGTCTGPRGAVTCQPVSGTPRVLRLTGTFLARRNPAAFPGS